MPEPRTKPRKTASKAAASANGDSSVTHEEIARRAYEIAQGDEAGSDEENWLRAEVELRSRSAPGG